MNSIPDSLFPEVSEKRAENIHIALLAAYAIGLRGIESFVPTPIPWLRLGFANIITLTALLLYGLRAGMTVTLIRVFVTSFFAGTFLGPAFVLSLGGGVSSTLVMWLAKVSFGRLFGPMGLSLFGALTHNIAQLFLAYFLFVKRTEAILFISPVIILLGTVTGAFNGIVTGLIIRKLKETKENKKP